MKDVTEWWVLSSQVKVINGDYKKESEVERTQGITSTTITGKKGRMNFERRKLLEYCNQIKKERNMKV